MKRVNPWFLIAAAALTFGGCSDDDDQARLSIQLTDAPFPYQMIAIAEIVVTGVEVHIKGNEDDEGFRTLSVPDGPRVLNLQNLQNGLTELLVDAEVPPGEIDQIRLIVSSASVTLTDARTFPLTVPSGDTSGLKIFPTPVIEAPEQLTTELLLDFDLSRSFHPIPASAMSAQEVTGFQFNPVLRVSNLAETGSVGGKVWFDAGTPANPADDVPIATATVTVWQSGTQMSSKASNGSGSFKFLGLAPGTTIVRVEAPGYVPGENTVVVIVGSDVGADFRLSATG